MGKISSGSKLLFIAFFVVPFSVGITIGHCYLDKQKDNNPWSRNNE
jgi:hypothetical protein